MCMLGGGHFQAALLLVTPLAHLLQNMIRGTCCPFQNIIVQLSTGSLTLHVVVYFFSIVKPLGILNLIP